MTAAPVQVPAPDRQTIRARFALRYDASAHRRLIANEEVIVHCHHYNCRIQRTVESAAKIDGRGIIRDVAEYVFARHVAAAIDGADDLATRWMVAEELYASLGFGSLDTSTLAQGYCRQTASHFVEGWGIAFGREERNVCTLAEGFLQGAHLAITGTRVTVRESACMHCKAESCRFEVTQASAGVLEIDERPVHDFTMAQLRESSVESEVDEQAIIDAVVALPIEGNEDGLIPAFGVYLANTPAAFYNLVAIKYVEAMEKTGQRRTATRLLTAAGEACAMNTFRGIMDSPEWEGLIAPMVSSTEDTMVALVALSNAFGWGNWSLTELEPADSATFVSYNGYEALGYLSARPQTTDPVCFMLQGVSAGMMELVYGEGSYSERLGTYLAEESHCIATANGCCEFLVEPA